MGRAGWYKQYRAIFDHPVLSGDVASRVHAFSDLVGMAEHTAKRRRVGATLVDLDRGQVLASVRYLAERWKWSKAKVQRFLGCLERESMVVPANETPAGTVYVVVNYESYQGAEDAERDTKRDSDGTPTGQARDKVEEVKEYLSNDQTNPREASKAEMQRDANAHFEALTPERRSAFKAEVRGVVSGDNAVSWRDGKTGLPVPWEDRPRRLRLALDALAKGAAETLHWALVFVHRQQDDPLELPTAAEVQSRPKVGAPQQQVGTPDIDATRKRDEQREESNARYASWRDSVEARFAAEPEDVRERLTAEAIGAVGEIAMRLPATVRARTLGAKVLELYGARIGNPQPEIAA